jgi:hypothetical protein
MTEYQLKIIFVLVLCAPIAYFGVRFFMSLVSNAIAGKKMPESKKPRKRSYAPEEEDDLGETSMSRNKKPRRRDNAPDEKDDRGRRR